MWTQNVWRRIFKLLQKHIFNKLFVEVTSRLISMPFTLSVIYQICPGSVLPLSVGWGGRFVQRAVVLSINLWLVSMGHISVWRSVCLYMRLTWSMIPCSLFSWKGWLSLIYLCHRLARACHTFPITRWPPWCSSWSPTVSGIQLVVSLFWCLSDPDLCIRFVCFVSSIKAVHVGR